MRTTTGIVALAAGGLVCTGAHGARIVDTFEHAPLSFLQLWVGQPDGQTPNLGTAEYRRRPENVLGGFRAAELEHVSSLATRVVRVSEAYTIPDALVYDGQQGSSAILRLEYSTDGASGMNISMASERFLEIDVVQAVRGGVRAMVELIGGGTAEARGTVLQLSQTMAGGAQVMRFDLGGAGFTGLSEAEMIRVTFDASDVVDEDFAIGEIRLVPTPSGAALSCAGFAVMLRRRR